MPIIEVEQVTKEFRLGQLRSLKQSLSDFAVRLRGGKPAVSSPFKALDDVNFTVGGGEVLGIIGHNGAGKSTLLKILAGISKPTHGRIAVRGKVAPLIEVGAGLVPDLTGRENIYVNATILGMKRAEIERRFDEIVDFAELEEFIDTPVKRYSSGMLVRLGFSIATRVEAEILIVDEVLAVGDLAFQRKCFDRMEELIKRQGRTVLLVSHNVRQVERLCSRVILLDHGKVLSDGEPTRVCNLFFDRSNAQIKSDSSRFAARGLMLTDDVKFGHVEVLDGHGAPATRIECLAPASLRFSFEALQPLRRMCFLIGIHTTDFIYLTANNTVERTVDYEPGTHAVELRFRRMTLLPGVYSVRVWIGTPEGRVSFYGENLCGFQVHSDDHLLTRQQQMGIFYMDATWLLKPEAPFESPLAAPASAG